MEIRSGIYFVYVTAGIRERKIRGKGSFLITVRVGINREIIFGVRIVRFGKGKNTHSETDLGVCSDYGGDPDPHRSARTRTDQEF